MATRLVDQLAQPFLGLTKVFDQPMITLGLLDRVEVLPLNIFGPPNCERLGSVECPTDRAHLAQPRPLPRAPAALTRDNLVSRPVRSHDDGLQRPALRTRLRQFLKRSFIEMPARLARTRR